MIFLTIGTQFPFDRLIRAVDDIFDRNFINEEIFAQVGESAYQPRNFESVVTMQKNTFDEYFQAASGIISHAGVGTITMALDSNKPLLVMPRLKKYGEVVNDHQIAIARKFEELGHILVAYREKDLPEMIEKLKTFVPKPRKNQAKVVSGAIAKYLKMLSQKRMSN